MFTKLKQTATPKFIVMWIVFSFVWLIFGWVLMEFKFSVVFQTIDAFSLKAWLLSPLAYKTPLILFWFIILAILIIGWLITLASIAAQAATKPIDRPIFKGLVCAVCVITTLLIVFHIADIFTTARVTNIKMERETLVTFRNGTELTLGELTFTSGYLYLNLPMSPELRLINRQDFDLAANKVIIGLKPKDSGIIYQEAYITKPFSANGATLLVQNFFGDAGSQTVQGVMLTMVKKPLLPFIAVLYIFLVLAILVMIASNRLEKVKVKAKPAILKNKNKR